MDHSGFPQAETSSKELHVSPGCIYMYKYSKFKRGREKGGGAGRDGGILRIVKQLFTRVTLWYIELGAKLYNTKLTVAVRILYI